jgi:hypothetical protein
MHRNNFACFFCKIVFKGTTKCPGCGRELFTSGSKLRFPAKSDAKGWKELEKFIAQGNPYIRERYDLHINQKVD